MKKQIQEFIAQNRQNIIDDWRDLVNMEGSCRQPDAMHTIADWLCEKFQQAGVDCQVYRVRDEVPPVGYRLCLRCGDGLQRDGRNHLP